MKKVILVLVVAGAAAAAVAVALARGPAPQAGNASSHREAPLIAEDQSADNTDLYAFRSPDKPDTFTIISNWIPGEDPAAGPNYYTFSQSARYNIYVDTNGDGRPDITYRARFKTPTGPFFLGNTVQSYTLTRNGQVVAKGQTPPNNIGPRTLATLYKTKNYGALAAKAVTSMTGGGLVFAGQRDDPFFADVGAIFDLLGFRKDTGSKGGGKDFLSGYNVHTIALQIPISQLHGKKIIGVWSSTDRQNVTVNGHVRRGWTQVSRLGEPLINEVIIPTGLKDLWNRTSPAQDAQFKKYYETPIQAAVLNNLYKLDVPGTGRDDLVAVL